ncbi:hypothetical protein N7488_012446 [Penicillium malachiteum]|nr:hypothetical protein N7488_012446 [Penicillium malachiteum]
MRLTWYANTEYQFMKQTILHEFGHMLGALHEHCSPDFPFQWNQQAIYHDYETYIRNEIQRTHENLTPSRITSQAWDRADGDIIRRPNQRNWRCSTFDDQSVMIYRIETHWPQPNAYGSGYPVRRTFESNYHLSYADGALMREVYGGVLRNWDADSSDSSIDFD